MSTIAEYQKQIEERKIIKVETRSTVIFGFASILSTLIAAAAAYFMKTKPAHSGGISDKTIDIISLIVVILLVLILLARRTVYYSPKLIKENFTLTQVLQKWKTVDVILICVAETLPICGLVLTFLGAPFERIFYLFVGGAVLLLLLTPLGIKVRSKLSILRESFPGI